MQIALFLETPENRIQRSGTDQISVPPKLLDHAESENRLLRCVVEEVHPDQTGVEIAIVEFIHSIRLRLP
jgi:hypothetical protein